MQNLDTIFQAQQNNRWAMAQTTFKERKTLLRALKKEIILRREEIKEALYQDFRKPYAESELTEIHTSIDEINFSLSHLKKWMKPKKVKTPLVLMGSKSYIEYTAKGVVLVLAPWNYPFQLLINPLVAAIAAGNCVIARPSEKTPATAAILEKIISTVFPANVATVVVGEIELAEKLLKLPFDHIFFTGSTNVGKKVMQAAAVNLTPVTLELGGKTPVIIDYDVNLEDCVQKVFWGKFMNAGQTCVAPDYVYIHEKHKARFIELFKAEIEKRFGESSSERLNSKDFARIVDVAAFQRLAGKLEGEKNLLNDDSVEGDRYIAPTLLTDVRVDSPVMQDEIFGPILPLLTYVNVDTVIDYINRNTKPLALYIFTKRNIFIEKVLENTTSGGVAINHVVLHLANPHLPFGGVGHSGMGSYHGEFGFKTFSHERSVMKQGRFTMSKLYFPPYNTFMSKMAFRILRWLE